MSADPLPQGSSRGRGRAALLATVAIRAYQFTLAPVLGGQCRFVPSCSAYALEAVAHHGAAKGLALAGRRVLRCHPWCEGGFDPVPTVAAGSWRSELVQNVDMAGQRPVLGPAGGDL